MIYLKQCPKCGGDLYDRKDIYGKYISCMQCGLHIDLEVNETLLRAQQEFPPVLKKISKTSSKAGAS